MILFILGLVVTGLILGVLARLLLPGRDPMSLGATLLLGIVGSILGGVIGNALFENYSGSFLLALATTIVLLLVYRKTVARNRA